MLEDVLKHLIRQKRAHTQLLITELLDDLSSSDGESEAGASQSSSSDSSDSSISSISSISSPSSIPQNPNSPMQSSSDLGSEDLDRLEDELFQRWDAQVKALAIQLLSARVLEVSAPVKKAGQLDLFLDDFRRDHPGRFRKKLRVSPQVFDRLVDLIKDHSIFHNNSNVPQLSVTTQLAIFLIHVGHYGNVSAPEYVAQWAGVSVGSVINSTYRCLVAFLALHDEVVMMPPDEEKERVKEYVEAATCPEWRNGFLLADGTKFPLFQKPGLHGEAWFDKNKNYSIDCQVRDPLSLSAAKY